MLERLLSLQRTPNILFLPSLCSQHYFFTISCKQYIFSIIHCSNVFCTKKVNCKRNRWKIMVLWKCPWRWLYIYFNYKRSKAIRKKQSEKKKKNSGIGVFILEINLLLLIFLKKVKEVKDQNVSLLNDFLDC